MSQIFVAKNYGQRGPFSEEEVYELLENNEFSWDDLAWREGMQGWDPLRTVLGKKEEKIAKKPPLPEVFFHHVAAWKFILLSLATLGLYELYWFYRGWSFVKRSEKSRIMPFWRTVFAPIWF